MARLARSAQRDIRELASHYLRQQRRDAVAQLNHSVAAALAAADNPATRWFAPPPCPYPELAATGFRWLKLHRSCFARSTAPDGEGIIHPTLPRRLKPPRP